MASTFITKRGRAWARAWLSVSGPASFQPRRDSTLLTVRAGHWPARRTKTEFNGIGGPANLHHEHARDRCLYRRARRSNCAYSGLFTLGAKGTQMTPPAALSLWQVGNTHQRS